jgi:hypothetical protein
MTTYRRWGQGRSELDKRKGRRRVNGVGGVRHRGEEVGGGEEGIRMALMWTTVMMTMIVVTVIRVRGRMCERPLPTVRKMRVLTRVTNRTMTR